jgi:hypothetical protein
LYYLLILLHNIVMPLKIGLAPAYYTNQIPIN